MSNNYERKNATPCMGCMRVLKWIPVLFIASVIVWSYYAYVVELCIFAIDNIFEKIIFIIFYHLIFFLFLWSYWNTIFTPVGTVPQTWRIPDADIERLYRAENQEQQKRILESFAKDYPVCNRTLNGSIRFCDKCRIIKPDRAHHCSVCGICVLKMDHHCPWVNNCVNFNNYKFFVLFLGYALLYCLYVALTSLEYFIRFWRLEFVQQGELNDSMGRFHILFLFFVALMFAISLVSLFGYHIYLVLMNRTTLEAFRAPIFRIGGPDKNGFNLGKFANFQEVFGDNWKLWFLPIYSSKGDGQHYPMSVQRQQQPQPQSQPQPQPQPQQKPQSHLQDYYCGQYRPQRNNSIYNSMGMKKNVVGSNVDSCVGASVYSSLEVQPIHQLIETNRILSTPSLPSSQLSLQIPMQCSTGYINSQNMVPQEQHRHQQQQQQQYHQYNTQQSIIEKLNTNEILEGVTVTSTSTTTTAITITPTLPTVASSALSSTSPSNLKKMATIASLLPNGTVFIDMQTNTQKQLKNNLLEQMPQSLTQQTTTPLPLNLNLNLHLPLSNTAAATLSS